MIGSEAGACELRLKSCDSSGKLVKCKHHNKKHRGYSSGIPTSNDNNTNHAMNGPGRLFTSDSFNALNFHQSGRSRPSDVWQYGGRQQPVSFKLEPTTPASFSSAHALNAHSPSKSELNLDYLIELDRIFERNFGTTLLNTYVFQIFQNLTFVQLSLGPMIKRVLKTLEKTEREKYELEQLEEIQNEWSQVALVADHFLCYFFPTLTIFLCIMIFFYSPHVLSNW